MSSFRPSPLQVEFLVEAFPYIKHIAWPRIIEVGIELGSEPLLNNTMASCSNRNFYYLDGGETRNEFHWIEIPGLDDFERYSRKLRGHSSPSRRVEFDSLGEFLIAKRLHPELIFYFVRSESDIIPANIQMTIHWFGRFDWEAYERGIADNALAEMYQHIDESATELKELLAEAAERFLSKSRGEITDKK